MTKKINSSIEFSVKNFKITVGTVDRNNPNTFYLDVRTVITPLEKKVSYDNDVSMLKRGFYDVAQSIIKEMNASCKDSFDKNCIVDMDIAKDRMIPKKKSHLSCQMYFKQKGNISFNSIVETMTENLMFIIDEFTSNINEHSFEIWS